MIVYLALYGLALSGLVFNANKDSRTRKTYLFIVFGLLILIAALRSQNVGSDLSAYYSRYYPQFADAKWSQITSVTMSEHWEWGFCALCKILAMISPNVQLFIVVTSIISVAPFAYFIGCNCKDVVFPTVFYIGMHIYAMSFNIIRQAIAVGIILIALEQLKRRHIIRFVLFTILATLFHTTAIIMLILLILERVPFNRYVIPILAAGGLAVGVLYDRIFKFFSNIPIFEGEYGIYTAGEGFARGAVTIHTLGMLLVLLVVFIFSFKESDGSRIPSHFKLRHGKLYLKKINLHEVSWPVSTLMYSSYLAVLFRFVAFFINVLARECYYFMPLSMIAYANNEKRNSTRDLIVYLAITLFFLYITIFRLQDLWGAAPFQFFWMGD